MGNNSSERFWEIDCLRGIAIILMIAYHLIFDLNYFGVYTMDLDALPVLLCLYPVSATFLLLVGVSLTLSYSKSQKTLSIKQQRLKFLKRGAAVMGLGGIITLATWVYPHDGFIVFGVLSCIGLSILLAYPLIRYPTAALLLGVLCMVSGLFLHVMITVDFPWLLWLGFIPGGFYSLDYFPLLPWFGVVLLGIYIGNCLYHHNGRKIPLKDRSQFFLVRGFSFLGRHSLFIYLLHQLIIVGVLYSFFLL